MCLMTVSEPRLEQKEVGGEEGRRIKEEVFYIQTTCSKRSSQFDFNFNFPSLSSFSPRLAEDVDVLTWHPS